jgi:kinetochor protein Mis14/NSL1
MSTTAPNIFDSTAPAHLGGVRGTEAAHRKIELQAPEDLTFLVAKLSEAARERIEKEFSTAASATEQGKDGGKAGTSGIGEEINEEDKAALKRRVEELVDEVSNISGSCSRRKAGDEGKRTEEGRD